MLKNLLKQSSDRPEMWLYIFLAIHCLGWSLVPIFVRYNLPLDSIEGTLWGHQLEWGYDKNPYLNGWLTALALYLDHYSGWMIYFFSQISVVVCLFAIWKLAKEILPSVYALIAVMILEGVQYYNFHAIDFNDNTLELSLWALTIYCFYQALKLHNLKYVQTSLPKEKNIPTSQKYGTWQLYYYWILTGLFAGLGLMAKYYTAALLTAMFLFILRHTETRKQLKTFPPYAGLFIFLIVILPHFIWLFFHDFITVAYVFNRASSEASWFNHIFFPAQFTWQQAQAFLPACILFGLFFIGKKPYISNERITLDSFNQSFLYYMGFGPFLLTIMLSMLFGNKLRAGWGMPLLSLWGIILMTWVQPYINPYRLNRFITAVFALIVLSLSFYSFSLIDSSDTSSANFPGQEIAKVITEKWQNTYGTQLFYVAGSRWVGGNISFYSNEHPAVFVEWNKQRAPWIDLADMEQKGAVFVWEISAHESLPDLVRAKFPALMQTQILEFDWKRNHYHLPPVKLGIAMLPPKK